MRKTTPILLVALALGACSTPSWLSSSSKEPVVEPNVFPAGYRREILAEMRAMLPDINKVRDAGISEPQLVAIDKDQRYAVCVRANTRDPYGRYPGPKDRIAYFFGGHLNQFVEATPEQCGRALYKPFPELEQACAGHGCENRR